jgi:hypothetical protein
MTYNLTASRNLVAALRDVFGDPKTDNRSYNEYAQRFDEYSIVSHAERLPLAFLNSRRTRQRVMIAHWLRWAAEQDIGLERDSTWFRVGRQHVCRSANVHRGPVEGWPFLRLAEPRFNPNRPRNKSYGI